MKGKLRSLPILLPVAALLALALLIFPSASGAQGTATAALDFHDAMRKLWEDHITWTRLYIVSFAADAPDTEEVAQRLIENQADIGDAIKPFYGEDAGNQLTQLLTEHITGAVDLLTAAKAGDDAAIEAASTAWNANGEAIAAFLNSANPDNWPLNDLKMLMQMHLDTTLKEAQARLAGDFAADIAAYDEVHDHILVMADALSNGIIKQFPDRFTVSTLP